MKRVPDITAHILVPIDGSSLAEQAIPYATRLGGLGSTLILLRVNPRAESIRAKWGSVMVAEARAETSNAGDAVSDLDRAGRLVPEAYQVDKRVVSGDPADQIIQTSLSQSIGMIVMASHGRGAVGRWTFGSVADRVARQSSLPVMIVRPTSHQPHDSPLDRIVVPLDGSARAAHALPVALEVARKLAIPVHLVRCVTPMVAHSPALAMGMPVPEEIYLTLVNDERSAAEETLSAAARRLREAGVDVTEQIPVAPAVPGIQSALEPGDVVIITSHGRGGIRRWLLGSVAERLVRDGLAPVILVPSSDRWSVAQPGSAERLAPANAKAS